VQGIRVDHRQRLGQCRFAGQGQRLGDEGGAAFGVGLQEMAGGIDEARRPAWRPAGRDGGRGVENQRRGEALAGFPGVERVGLVGEQQGQLFGGVGELEDDRRREVA
jgi:hypothetical protein